MFFIEKKIGLSIFRVSFLQDYDTPLCRKQLFLKGATIPIYFRMFILTPCSTDVAMTQFVYTHSLFLLPAFQIENHKITKVCMYKNKKKIEQ